MSLNDNKKALAMFNVIKRRCERLQEPHLLEEEDISDVLQWESHLENRCDGDKDTDRRGSDILRRHKIG